MVDFEMRPEGFNELAADLSKTGVKAAQMALLAVQKTAKEIEAGAKNRAPVDTGNLKNSITTSGAGLAGVGTSEAVVSTGVHYAPYVEFGTSRMAAQPFFGPAVDAAEPGFNAAMAAILEGLI